MVKRIALVVCAAILFSCGMVSLAHAFRCEPSGFVDNLRWEGPPKAVSPKGLMVQKHYPGSLNPPAVEVAPSPASGKQPCAGLSPVDLEIRVYPPPRVIDLRSGRGRGRKLPANSGQPRLFRNIQTACNGTGGYAPMVPPIPKTVPPRGFIPQR